MVDAKLTQEKILKVSFLCLQPFLSYRENPAGGAESASPAGRGLTGGGGGVGQPVLQIMYQTPHGIEVCRNVL